MMMMNDPSDYCATHVFFDEFTHRCSAGATRFKVVPNSYCATFKNQYNCYNNYSKAYLDNPIQIISV